MTKITLFILLILQISVRNSFGFVVNGGGWPSSTTKVLPKDTTIHQKSLTSLHAVGVLNNSNRNRGNNNTEKEGGLFSLHTKYGNVNLYGLYYGIVEIVLGCFWYLALSFAQLFYFITRGKVDKKRRLPVFISHVWGWATLKSSLSYPVIENREILQKFYKENRAAMFVANHASFQDIPFIGMIIGWKNYKFIAKKELLKIPVLGKAISLGDHISIDRNDSRDQIRALKKGIHYLKNNVNLCTFPEGTRSSNGRLMEFKSGAFKIASKAHAPIIPVAIVASNQVQPRNWIFPCRTGKKISKLIICEPIETKDKDETDIEKEVRDAILKYLPENQHPN